MNSSQRTLRLGAAIAVLGSAVFVAGCGGSSSTPTTTPTTAPTTTPTTAPSSSPSSSPTGSASSSPSPSPSSTATSSQPLYTFTGASNSGTAAFGASGGTLNAGPYQGLSIASTWGAVQGFTSTVTMTAYLATGSGDITASSGSFPAFASTQLVNSSGTNIADTFALAGYLELTASPIANFAQTPAFVFTSASISGSTCYIFSLNNASTTGGFTPVWSQQFGSSSKTATTATFAAQTVNQVKIGNPAGNSAGNGPTYLAVACQ